MFRIHLIGARPSYTASPSCTLGELVIGPNRLRFELDLTHWSATDYERQWQSGIMRLVHGATSSALMTAYRGKNTVEAIQIGIQLAIVGAAEEAVFGFASDCKEPPTVFITGGERHYFGSWEFVAEVREIITHPTLTLEGIRIAAEALP